MAHFHVLDGVVADPTSFTEINKEYLYLLIQMVLHMELMDID